MSKPPPFTGRRIVVTGAGSGIGRATASRLAGDGASVALLDIDRVAAMKTLSQLTTPARHVVVEADVADEASVEAGMATVVKELGGIDGAVVNAAIQLFGRDSGALDVPIDIFDRTLAVNLRGAFLSARTAARHIIVAGGGSIAFTGSPTGLGGGAWTTTAYAVSKAAVHGLARTMAVELAPHGVRVNVVIPGFTATPLVSAIDSRPEDRDALVATIPMGRQGRADEAAAAIAFVMSDEASFMTGSLLVADGGAHAR